MFFLYFSWFQNIFKRQSSVDTWGNRHSAFMRDLSQESRIMELGDLNWAIIHIYVAVLGDNIIFVNYYEHDSYFYLFWNSRFIISMNNVVEFIFK